MLIDTHCHLGKEDYEDINKVVNNMDGIMIASGCDDKTNKEVIGLVNQHANVYGTLGLHPEEIDKITEESFSYIEENINNPKIVAIGEIGLDYYWDKINKEEQKELFIKQLDIAEKYNMPIVVHSRDAIEDTYNILKNYNLKGSIHCFSSSLEMAKKFIKLGYKIGVGGVVTFKNASKLKEVVKGIDIEDILLETDSPYLAPEPYRGKKNEPSYVKFVAQEISNLKQISIEEVLNITTKSANTIFDLNIDI